MVDSDVRVAWQLFNLNWIPIAAMGSVLLLAVAVSNFALEPVAFGTTAAIAVVFGLIAYVYTFARGHATDPKVTFSLGTISQVILVTAIVGPLSYVAGATQLPLQDQTFLLIDRAMGMDLEPIARFVDAHPMIAHCLHTGYGFIKWPLLGIPIILTMTLRLVRLQLFVAALCFALAVTIAVSALVPAIGTFYGLHLSAESFGTLDTVYAAQLRDIVALRNGSLRHLELFQLAGIVSFPSFHAASAVLYMWALWPVRGFASLSIAMNVLMIAATPVIGAHYMIDVIGGILLAAVSIILVNRYLAFMLAAGEPAQASALKAWPVQLKLDAR
ncbi:MAG TPA: phosphatase PAP2 family protein [Bradyrhizobium sp.]|jgi:membrane-associated phospholipid phosphatase|nr:phosphatase PAP2 family protein [Bradyrhizobium sp.]